MKLLLSILCGLLALSAGNAFAGNQDPDWNVNSRYTVESVHISGSKLLRLSDPLRNEIARVIGAKLDNSLLDRLASRIRSELRTANVGVKVLRGTQPEHVSVEFEVANTRKNFDIALSKLAYQSRSGFSGAGQITTRAAKNELTFGVIRESDDLIEQFTGVKAKIERKEFNNRLTLRFEYDGYHEDWSRQTLSLSATDLYRTRQNFEPSATFAIAGPLTMTVGMSFERLENQFAPASIEAAHTVLDTLRYHKRWQSTEVDNQELDASYNLRAGVKSLGSDYGYTRQLLAVRYAWAHDRSVVSAEFQAGAIGGEAPLYDRFALGTSTTLRGWNKFDLSPLGANRIVYGSVTYRYRFAEVFYDTGAVWDKTGAAFAAASISPEQKQSVGVGIRKDGFVVATAFPIRGGHIDPVFIAGMWF